jgi:hypothetical protein
MKESNNYLCHTNEWYWGVSVDIVHKQGLGIVCVKLDNDYPQTAFICDLSVFVLNRKQGLGRELMENAFAVQRNMQGLMRRYKLIRRKIGLSLGIKLLVLKLR